MGSVRWRSWLAVAAVAAGGSVAVCDDDGDGDGGSGGAGGDGPLRLEELAFPGSPFPGALSATSFGTALVLDGDVVRFVEDPPETGTVTGPESPFGAAVVTTLRGRSASATRETRILALADPPDTFVVQHTYTFAQEHRLGTEVGFSVTLEGAAGARLAYGPADDTVYMLEDYLAIPAIDGYAKPGRMLFGGLPLEYAWNERGGIAVGVLAAAPGTFALPLEVTGGRVTLAQTHVPDPGLGERTTVGPDAPLRSELVFVSYHDGDYFEPLARYSRLLERVLGRPLRDVPSPDAARAPYWKTWGLDPAGSGAFTKDDVRRVTGDLRSLGIGGILLDWGWFETEGDWRPSSEVFAGEDDLRGFIQELKADGFQVGLWFQPLQVDPEDEYVQDALLAYAVRDEDGDLFLDDDDLALLDPSWPPVRDALEAQLARFAALGVDHVYVDSQIAQLAVPPNFARADPLASHRALPLVYDALRARGKELGFVVELCPDGRSHTVLDLPQDIENVGDPKNDRALRAELKSLKALLGGRAVVGAYVDPFPDNGVSGSFLNIVGLGGKLETFFRSPDDLGRQRWVEAMRLYTEEDLVSGEYVDAYDIAFDVPEGHLVRRGEKLYFTFFTATEGLDVCLGASCEEDELTQVEAPGPARYAGPIELRGLTPGARYSVARWPGGAPEIVAADADGRVTLGAVEFEKEVLLVVAPAP